MTIWSKQSRRSVPIKRSAMPFCHGDPEEDPPVANAHRPPPTLERYGRRHGHCRVYQITWRRWPGESLGDLSDFETVDWATSNPSISSSPWIRDGAPQRVFPTHSPDQIRQASIDLRLPYPISRYPTPSGFKASAMAPQDCFRLYYLGHAGQVRPEAWSSIPAARGQNRAVEDEMVLTQSNIELMTEKRILGLMLAPRLEQISDEHYESMKDRKRSPAMTRYSTLQSGI